MVKALYLEDSYLQKCNANVLKVTDGKYVVLDKTLFYPKGGGQPWDTGRIIRGEDVYHVVYVGKFLGEISHEVNSVGLRQEDKVLCILNWDRRYKLMRSHTAAHTFASLLCDGTGALITGNQLGVDKTRFDFSLENLDRTVLQRYITEANKLFMKNIPVKCYELPRNEALKIPGIIKMAGASPPNIPSLRIVEIVGIDKQVDGGTHVRNLLEVGQINLIKAENKGRNNRRIYFCLDPS